MVAHRSCPTFLHCGSEMFTASTCWYGAEMELKKNKKKNTWRLFFLNRNISQTLITPPAQRLTREALALFIFKLVLPVTPSIQHNQREQRLQRYTVFPLGFFFPLVSYIAGILANPSHTDRITCWDTDQTLHPGFTYWSITDTHTHASHMKRTHSHTHTCTHWS